MRSTYAMSTTVSSIGVSWKRSAAASSKDMISGPPDFSFGPACCRFSALSRCFSTRASSFWRFLNVECERPAIRFSPDFLRPASSTGRIDSKLATAGPQSLFTGPLLQFDAKNYQRGSRRCRGPPPCPRPPPPPNPPPPPGPRPPPPPAGFGLASLTFKARPPTFAPFNAVIARSASSVSVISTNANPRERPVSRSVIRLTRSTVPYASNSERTVSSVAPKSRFPTNMFFKVFS
jgi:hypothetical protein